MLWRHLCLVRAWSAAGLLTCSLFAASAPAEPEEPAPPAEAVTETVQVLQGRESGDLTLDLRGQGQDRVRIAIKNTSAKRLNVVLPPGLVAASATGQGRAGGGFQSMGLGSVSNRPGSFGAFQATRHDGGFQSLDVAEDARASTVTVPAGKTVELSVPAVCLNFGLPTPTPRDRFDLVDVDDYTRNLRARKALRTLATMGTSHGVAQAVAWNVFNDVPFEAMVAQFSKVVNVHDVALAARFVETLDTSAGPEPVDPAYVTGSRLFVQVQGDGPLARDAQRLNGELDGLYLLGLPVQVVGEGQTPDVPGPALHVMVTLTGTKPGETRGRVLISHATATEGWTPLGKTSFSDGSTLSVLDGPELARALDRAIAAAFVSAKPVKHGSKSTTLKVENRLPFTIANLSIKPVGSSGNPSVPLKGVGIGPAHSALLTIEAADGNVDRIELNGL